MANQEHLDILKQGVLAWNEWRAKNPDIRVDFSTVNRIYTDLIEAGLNNTEFRSAHLRSAHLRIPKLSEANLERADLSNAHLHHTLQLHFKADQHQVQEEGKQAT